MYEKIRKIFFIYIFNFVIVERDLVNKYLILSRKIDLVLFFWLNYCNMYMWYVKMIFIKYFVFKLKGKINVMV